MDNRDQVAIPEAMEQQTISITKVSCHLHPLNVTSKFVYLQIDSLYKHL